MKAKLWLKVWLITVVIAVSLVGVVNYIVDPYGLRSNKDHYVEYLCYLNNPAVTNLKINLQADTYLIGTSMVIRIDPNVVEAITHKRVFNVNNAGATLPENMMIAKKVKAKGAHFVYGFDAFSLNKMRLRNPEIKNRLETYKEALQKDPLIDITYFSFTTFVDTLNTLLKEAASKPYSKDYEKENNIHYETTLEDVDHHLELSTNGSRNMFSDFETFDDEMVIELAKLADKEDIFVIYPKQFYHYVLFQRHLDIEAKYFHAIKLLVENTNAKVYSFYGENEVTRNSDNFDADGWHFKPSITPKIMAKIYGDKAASEGEVFGTVLDKTNIDRYLDEMHQSLQKYQK